MTEPDDTPVTPMQRIPRPTREDSNAQMRARSGMVDGGPLATLVYTLLRDGLLCPGTLERLLDDFCGDFPVHGQFTNGWLGQYSNDVAQRLLAAEKKRQDTSGEMDYIEKAHSEAAP